ncbi:MAG: cystathionine gamma-synthase family protein [Fervidicoccaceae archaeon]|jgi:cystathionine gamma-synthase
MKMRTASIHAHGFHDRELGVRMVPIYLTSMFEQPNPISGETKIIEGGRELKYAREEGPTTRYLEKTLAVLEGGEDALAFNSGMGAITSLLLTYLRSGMKVVVPMESYSGTIALLQQLSERINFRVVKVWPSTEKIVESIEEGADMAIVETMTNPTLRVIDVGEVARVSKERGTKLIVDNTLASPVIYTPLSDGALFAVESATKYIAGHNDAIGGFIAGSEHDLSAVWEWRKLTGTILQPTEAFLIQRGIKTLEIRFEAHSRNAQVVAEFLSEHPKVEEVFYPGLSRSPHRRVAEKLFKKKLYGGIVSFIVRGGEASARTVLKNLKLIIPSPSFGGPESLLTYPVISASKYIPKEERDRLGITEGLLRLSVGLEDVDDIIEDLDRALRAIA